MTLFVEIVIAIGKNNNKNIGKNNNKNIGNNTWKTLILLMRCIVDQR